jgi:acetyl esterase
MALDPPVQDYLERIEKLGLPPLEEVTPGEARAQSEVAAPMLFGPVEEVALVEDFEVSGVSVRSYRPSADRDLPLLVYAHGGGWVTGSLDTYDGVCRALANRVPCRVLSVGYRLAPEHPFPAALEDCWEATRWAVGEAPSVAVGGDSAGGNLAAAVALRARDAGLPLAFQLLIYPVTDFEFGTGSYAANAVGRGLTQAEMRWYWAHYLGGADGAQPEASPLRAAELGGAAPALVVVCEYDPLRDEGVAYARRLEEARVPVRLVEYAGMIHGFVRMAAITERTQVLLEESASALREAFAKA